jgi:hypothetical protein
MPPVSSALDRLLVDLKDLTLKGSNLFSQINGKIVKLKADGEFPQSYAEPDETNEPKCFLSQNLTLKMKKVFYQLPLFLPGCLESFTVDLMQDQEKDFAEYRMKVDMVIPSSYLLF